MSSGTGASPALTPTQDLAANVSLEHASAAAATDRLVCPICNDEMVCGILFFWNLGKELWFYEIEERANVCHVGRSRYCS